MPDMDALTEIRPYAVIIVLCCLLAARDGINYYIYGKPTQHVNKLKGWHFIGGLIYAIGCLSVINNWYMAGIALVARFGLYDIVHNLFAKMPVEHIGTEALTDKITRKIFGNTIIKLIVSVIALIILIWINSAKN